MNYTNNPTQPLPEGVRTIQDILAQIFAEEGLEMAVAETEAAE
jgi:hypothetical protein